MGSKFMLSFYYFNVNTVQAEEAQMKQAISFFIGTRSLNNFTVTQSCPGNLQTIMVLLGTLTVYPSLIPSL